MTSKRVPLALILSAVLTLTLTLTSSYAQDNWNGGIGNWSNAADWSAGSPGAGSDVVIYSGGYDDVTYCDEDKLKPEANGLCAQPDDASRES